MSDYISKSRKVADSAEVFILENNQTMIKFENGQLSAINEDDSIGVALRVIKDKKLGFSSTTRPESVDELIQRAINTVPYGADANFDFAPKAEIKKVACFDPEIEKLKPSKMIEFGEEIIEKVSSIGSEIDTTCTIVKNIQSIFLENTADNKSKCRHTYFGIGVEGKITAEGNFIAFEEDSSGTHLMPDIERICRNIKADYMLCEKNVPLKTGEYDIILEPRLSEDLLRPITAMMDGKNVEKKISPLYDKMNKQVFDSRLTIIDDPEAPGRTGTAPFDDEGVTAVKKSMIEKGVVKNYLHNLSSSAALKTKPLGNGHRIKPLLGGKTYVSMPMPSNNNLVISPGAKSSDELIKSIKNGVYIKNMMGTLLGHHVTGVVSGNLWLAYRIQNGELIGRVKDCMMTFNVLDVLKNHLADLSSDTLWYGNHCSPYMHLKDILISSK